MRNANLSCPFCQSPHAKTIPQDGRDDIECLSCGIFSISDTARAVLPHHLSAPHFLRKVRYLIVQRNSLPKEAGSLIFYATTLDAVHKVNLPNPAEQAERLILWLGESTPLEPSKWIALDEPGLAGYVGAAGGGEIKYLAQNLVRENLLEYQTSLGGGNQDILNLNRFRLTLKGWERYNELRANPSPSNLSFMAMSFRNPDIIRAYTECFKPAVSETGHDLRIVTDNQPTGLIDDHIIVGIQRARFIVADLTDGNQGAYWEAGYAEGLRRPVIYTCEKSFFNSKESGGGVHFDTAHRKIIRWEIDRLAEAAEEIITTIRATIPEAK
jgi:hypothetical protein